MSEYSSYFLYRKYQVLNGELIDLGITSVDGDGTMPLVTRNECDPACGCQTEPIYRWITVSGGYECSGTTKMAQEKEQVSNDNGETWSDVSPLTTRPALPVIKYNSEDCGYIPPTPECKCSAYTYSFTSATVSSAATSITLSYTGCSKLDLASAATYNWIAIGGQNYNSGTSVGNVIANISANTSTARNAAFYLFLDGTGCNTIYISQQSGATPAFEGKFKLTLSDSSTASAECDSTSAITRDEISAYSASVTSAVIGDCVTSIGSDTFYECTGLTSIDIPSSVISIGSWAFYGCSGLTSINIPNSVTSIGNSAFYNCRGLTSVTISDNVTSIGNTVFRNCTGLTSIDIPSGVTSIGYQAFRDCSSLTNIVIPNSVTSIDSGVLRGCSGLTGITCLATTPPTLGVSVFDNTNNCPIYVPCESVNAYKTAWSTYANRIQCNEPVFEGKYKLTLSDSSTASAECDSTSAITRDEISAYSASVTSAVIGDCVTSIGYAAFDDFESLTSVTIPNSVTSIGGFAFNSCSGLTNVTIPNSVTSIGNYVFQFCYSLTDVTMPSGITSIPRYIFAFCYNLTGITIPSGVTSIGEGAFDSCSGLTSIAIPDGVTSIGDLAFEICKSLTSCTIGSGVTTIGNRAFYECWSLTGITIPGGVTSIGYSAFEECTSLTGITIPSSVTYIGKQAFLHTKITDVTIPSGVTGINEGTFNACDYLTSVTIPSGVTSIGNEAFYYCNSLTSMTIYAVTPPTLGTDAFKYTNNCPIYVPSASVNTYKSASGWSSYSSRIVGIEPCPPVFEGKYKLTLNDSSTVSAECNSSSSAISDSEILAYTGSVTSAVIGDCVTEIGVVAFYNCSGLTNVTIPNSVTSIDDNAFDSCTSLASIDIPDSVTYIGEYAFISCTSLTSVTINATTPPTLGSDAFTDTPIANGTGTIYVPSGSVNTYKSASGWSSYSSRIQAIP